MAGAEHTSGYWLNTDGYKNLDKQQQASIQQDYVNMNKNQQAGKFNGFGATDIAQKYGLYKAPSVDQKINSINQGRQDSFAKMQSGYYDNAENRKYATSDELYANDLYKKTGDTTYWKPYSAGQAESPYDDLMKFFGLPSQLGNNKAYDVWKNQSDMFKGNTMAGNALGIFNQQQQGYTPGGSGGGGAGGGKGGEFDEFLKMFMAMMAMQGGQGNASNNSGYKPSQYGDGVHLFESGSPSYNTGTYTLGSSEDSTESILKKLNLWKE